MATVSRSIDVNVEPYEAYQWWRGLTRLPAIMPDVESVEGGVELTHWKVRGPLGTAVEWDARITEDIENRSIAWQSVADERNDVRTSGIVQFEPVGTGTRVKVELSYEPTGGPIGEAVARIFADPEDKVERALRAFKDSVESGGSLTAGETGPGLTSSGMPGTTTTGGGAPGDMIGGQRT